MEKSGLKMEKSKEQQALEQQLKDLQALIINSASTDTALKNALEQMQADCLKKLVELAKQTAKTTTPLTQSTPEQQPVATPIATPPTTTELTPPPTTQQELTTTQQPLETQAIAQAKPTIPTAISKQYATFHNDVNFVSLGKLGALEANLLFAIFNKLKDRQDELLVFDLDEIKAMVHAVKISKNELSGVVKRLWKNIRTANFWILLPKRDENHMLFKTFAINYHDTQKTQVKSMEIQVNMPYFGYLLNFLNANFTSFELLEFQNIRGKYAKTLYRLLKQWKSVGVPPRMEWGKFRELMGVPNKIKLIRVIEYEILKPAIQELKKLPQFESLCYEKLKTKGMGNRITHIQFYFQPTTKTSKDKEQAKRDLRTIAWKIRSQQVIEQIKRSKKQRAEQAKQEDSVMEILGAAFSKPQDPSIVLVIDSIHPALKGYDFLAKYYQNGQEIGERSATLASKEILLESLIKSGYQRIDLAQQSQQVAQTQQPTQIQLELQQDSNGFKSFQGLVRPNQPKQNQQPPVNPKDDLTDYIGCNLYMNKNGVPASLKIKDIARLKNGKIQVEVRDVDKPRKALNPFKFESAAHFKNWFAKFAE
ncbi:replication initiation protein [Helicobacter suis]|uniref:replication initiation protein n=1 Tax=Helicobacter suis TaxID=104628 RepID=UPI002480E5AD|nr:replication initiation protein [Helicobacter suis]